MANITILLCSTVALAACSGTNVALNKPVTASVDYGTQDAAHAGCLVSLTDGVTGKYFAPNAAHTDNALNAWVQIDLQQERKVAKVKIWGAWTEGSFKNINPFVIILKDKDGATVHTSASMSLDDPLIDGTEFPITYAGPVQHVRMQLDNHQAFLIVGELQVFPPTSCDANERVVSNGCVGCAAGETSAAGQLMSGPDTSCNATICDTNQKVVANICTTCPAGMNGAGNRDASGANTTCNPIMCSATEKVVNHTCVTCPPGMVSTGSDASTSDTTCMATCEVPKVPHAVVSGAGCIAAATVVHGIACTVIAEAAGYECDAASMSCVNGNMKAPTCKLSEKDDDGKYDHREGVKDYTYKGSVSVTAGAANASQVEAAMRTALAKHFGCDESKVLISIKEDSPTALMVSFTIVLPSDAAKSTEAKMNALNKDMSGLSGDFIKQLQAAGVDTTNTKASSFVMEKKVNAAMISTVPTPVLGSATILAALWTMLG